MRVLVVGAGIAGSTLAWWLARDGVDVTVVERAGEAGRAAAPSTSGGRPPPSSSGWG